MKLFSVYSDMTVKSENFVFLYSWLIIAGVIVFQQQQKKPICFVRLQNYDFPRAFYIFYNF